MKRIEVAAYYFPNYHLDERNEHRYGPGWTEWELLKRAEPRFEGHQQPKVPVWGYEDESDPAVMAKKIDAAADHGVDTFIFDWYWYQDRPFLQRGLEEGFLKAENSSRMKFALMWANHKWIDLFPMKRCKDPLSSAPTLYEGAVDAEGFEHVVDYCIKHYFRHPSYWTLDGKPYFSFYDINTLMRGLGSVEETRRMLDLFRAKAQTAGFPGLHLNAIVWENAFLPGTDVVLDSAQLVQDLGFDSVGSYIWIHHYPTEEFPAVEYNAVRDAYMKYWDEAGTRFSLPYYPNVTMGWDASPRTVQSDVFDSCGYPFMYTIKNNTPDNFRDALQMVKDKLEADGQPHPFVTFNAWNEWTEGSYLEPDEINGMKYLEAIREVFKSAPIVASA